TMYGALLIHRMCENDLRSRHHVARGKAPMSMPADDRRFRPVVDTLVALATASTPFLDLYVDAWSDSSSPPLTFAMAGALALLIGVPLLFRRRCPFAVLGLLLLVSIVAAIAGGEEVAIPIQVATAVALYTVATI